MGKRTDTGLHLRGRSSSTTRLSGTGSAPFSWADLEVITLILILSVPSLIWFGHNWTLIGNDAARYLLSGSQFISGRALEDLNTISEFNGGHGPGLPALIGALILLFGHDTAELVWAVRLLALLNPLLAYFLVRRISGTTAGLIASALVALLSYNVKATIAVNLDALLLTFYLLALLTLLEAIRRNGSLLALLSGVLLGCSILTKETAVVNVPLALLAVLLLDWELRGALWHYLGVVLVCLPWWIWAYSATGEIYLIDRLPVRLQVVVLVATATVFVLAAGAYASGIIARFLAEEHRRRWSGWFVVFAWTVLLTGLLLATAAHALGKVSFEDLRVYLADLLAPSIVVVPTMVVGVGYVAWKAIRQNGPWTLIALALLFQMPVSLLVTVERWALRQFLIPQTLVFCVLAALVVAAGEAAWQERRYTGRLIGASITALLAILLLVSSAKTVQALLLENSPRGSVRQHGVAPQVPQMIDWMDENVPEGEHILIVAEPAINVAQANYLMFLDAGRHRWTKLRLDQGICQPRPNIQIKCDPDQNAISRIPPDAAWVQSIGGRCRVVSLSMSNLLEQLRQNNSDYVLISGSNVFPGILELPSPLQASNAFEVVHAERAQRAGVGANQGVILLKSTGRVPKAVPTQMDARTAFSLVHCEQ